ncbi:MAG: polyprenyl synthetase family protein [Phycisphaerales bacterium]|nr:polyprenyl synthetase family protein [Phycisphaerales bacterium]
MFTSVPIPAATPEVLAVAAEIQLGLSHVERVFENALDSDLPPVQRLVAHLESYRGKMLRPALVVLSGLAASAEHRRAGGMGEVIGPKSPHVVVAAVCEMIHMATLVHDDVLDEADIRRKGATVNRLRGNEAAVILGDYLFSSAYRLCSTLDSQHAALLIGQTGMTLCAGELLQLHHRENLSIDEETYFEIVERKTGSLIAVACKLGAMMADVPNDARNLPELFHDVGMKLGVAFQIQDDLLDLTGNQAVVGKPLRKDLQLGKLTLPVIHHLASASPSRRSATLQVLEDFSPQSAGSRSLVDALESTGSIEHARSTAQRLVDEAKGLLSQLPDSPAKALLVLMADQVVARAA